MYFSDESKVILPQQHFHLAASVHRLNELGSCQFVGFFLQKSNVRWLNLVGVKTPHKAWSLRSSTQTIAWLTGLKFTGQLVYWLTDLLHMQIYCIMVLRNNWLNAWLNGGLFWLQAPYLTACCLAGLSTTQVNKSRLAASSTGLQNCQKSAQMFMNISDGFKLDNHWAQ